MSPLWAGRDAPVTNLLKLNFTAVVVVNMVAPIQSFLFVSYGSATNILEQYHWHIMFELGFPILVCWKKKVLCGVLWTFPKCVTSCLPPIIHLQQSLHCSVLPASMGYVSWDVPLVKTWLACPWGVFTLCISTFWAKFSLGGG